MAFHVAALFTHDESGDLLRINEPHGGGGIAPRFFLGLTMEGVLLRFRSDVDEGCRRELTYAAARLTAQNDAVGAPLAPDVFRSIIERSAPIAKLERGPAFVCPIVPPQTATTIRITTENASCLEAFLPDWLGDVEDYQPMVALVRNGVALSLCSSVRKTEHAHEAGVDTAAPARGHGYAPIVVTAWASVVQSMGRVPLYSTSWENSASRAVARKLGLMQFGNDLHIT